jgi:four helix bundle protein
VNISHFQFLKIYRCLPTQTISRTEGAYRMSEANKRGSYMNKTIKELALELTVETTAVCDNIKGRSVFVNQLLRACSSIGANSYEAKYAQSTADFVNKLEIALKECHETQYWLEVLFATGSMSEATYKNLSDKCGTIRRKLIASITTAKNQNK